MPKGSKKEPPIRLGGSSSEVKGAGTKRRKRKTVPKELYDDAFAFLDTKLWEKLYDTDLFGVRLSGGKTVYSYVTGKLGSYHAIVILRDEREISEYHKMVYSQDEKKEDLELILYASDLRLVFDDISDFSKSEARNIKDYIKKSRPGFVPTIGYPHFLEKKRFCIPWETSDAGDDQTIAEVLRAAVYFSGKYKSRKKSLFSDIISLPVIVQTDKGCKVIQEDAPPFSLKEDYPEPAFDNEIMLYRLRQLRRSGKLECELIFLPCPMCDDEDEPPVFPALLLCMNVSSGYIAPLEPKKDCEKNASEMLTEFASAIAEAGTLPETIRVSDSRTKAFLSDFCKKLGIELKRAKPLKTFISAKEELLDHIAPASPDDEMTPDDLAMMLSTLNDEDFHELPDELVTMMSVMADRGLLTGPAADKIKNEARRREHL